MSWGGIFLALFGPGTWGAGGNIVAWVLCGILGVAGAWLMRDRIGRHLAAWWARHHGPHAIAQHREALARIAQDAAAALRIAADTYEHHAGRRHPDSPENAKREDGAP